MDVIEIYNERYEKMDLNLFKLGDKFFVEEGSVDFRDKGMKRNKISKEGVNYLSLTNNELVDIIYLLRKKGYYVVLDNEDVYNTIRDTIRSIMSDKLDNVVLK